ncbi:MAG TPA: hypothetical protein VNA20_08010 [Frankiaceae bacterium]|nr:hypothetical protein [Frankiaceae bacterium]
MTRLVVGVAAAVAALSAVLPASATAVEMPGLDWSATLGGGAVDVATGEPAGPAPEDPLSDGSAATVLPYRAGARYRVPVLLALEPGAGEVVVTGVRLVTGAVSAARPAGAVYSRTCCVLRDVLPLDSFVLRPTEAASVVVVGVEVELCCAPVEAGWVERLPGIEVTYRRMGVTRTEYRAFGAAQTVVVRG